MSKTFDIGIIGGGLAGTSTAYALASAGLSVIVVERGESLASGASGNAQGLATPYHTSNINPAHEVYDGGLRILRDHLDRFSDKSLLPSLRKLPALQFPSADRPKRLLDSDEMETISERTGSELCGIDIRGETLLYPEAIVLSPAELCRAYASHENCTTTYGAAVAIERDGLAWHIELADQSISVKKVVIANAFDAKNLAPTSWMFLEPVRGQLVTFPAHQSSLRSLKIPLCFDGYLLPALNRAMLLGASYSHDIKPPDTTASERDTEDLFLRLNQWIKTPVIPIDCTARVSYRTSTFDRLPYVGQLPDFQEISSKIIRWNAISHATLPQLDGVYVNLGHGSRGLISTAISASILAQQIISGRHQDLIGAAKTLDPKRLILRMIRREEICQGRDVTSK